MCGIIFTKQKTQRDALSSIVSRYFAQRHRGQEGFGFMTLNPGGKASKITKVTTEYDFIDKLISSKSKMYLAHHRFPTSNINIENSCHPFDVEIGDYVFSTVHNGIINNDDEVFKLYPEYVPQSLAPVTVGSQHMANNDSEALALDLAICLSESRTETTAKGSIAFITVRTDKKSVADLVYFGRNNTSPLYYKVDGETLIVSSETEDKDATLVSPNELYCYDLTTGILSRTDFTIKGYVYAGNYQNPLFHQSDDRDYREYGYAEYDEHGREIKNTPWYKKKGVYTSDLSFIENIFKNPTKLADLSADDEMAITTEIDACVTNGDQDRLEKIAQYIDDYMMVYVHRYNKLNKMKARGDLGKRKERRLARTLRCLDSLELFFQMLNPGAPDLEMEEIADLTDADFENKKDLGVTPII